MLMISQSNDVPHPAIRRVPPSKVTGPSKARMAEIDSETLAKLVHDLRGPVSRVRAVSELLREELQSALAASPQADLADEWLTMIDRAVVRIDTLLQDLIDSARPAERPSTRRKNGA